MIEKRKQRETCKSLLTAKLTQKLPVGSRKSGRSGVRCITLGSELGGGRTAAALTLLPSVGWAWGRMEMDDGAGKARRMEADGGGDAWLGRSICLLWHVQKPSIVEMTMWSFFVQKMARSRKHKKGGPSQNAPTAHAKKHKT